MSNYLFLLVVVACPLMMFWMMRGMHGGRRGEGAEGGPQEHESDCGHGESRPSLAELQRRRDRIEREIEERKAEENDPVGSGFR
jgi:hypothetical protein